MVLRLSSEQREARLAEPRVGVLSVAAEAGRAPLTTPIWYDYRPGGLVMVLTSSRLRKARLISDAGRFALCVQDTGVPYWYVTAEGPVVEVRPVTAEDRRAIASRYMPPEIAAVYLETTHEDQSSNVAITMRPERWHTADYSDLAERLHAAV